MPNCWVMNVKKKRTTAWGFYGILPLFFGELTKFSASLYPRYENFSLPQLRVVSYPIFRAPNIDNIRILSCHVLKVMLKKLDVASSQNIENQKQVNLHCTHCKFTTIKKLVPIYALINVFTFYSFFFFRMSTFGVPDQFGTMHADRYPLSQCQAHRGFRSGDIPD